MSRYRDLVTPILPEVAAMAAEVDAEARFPEAGFDRLREAGLLGLLVPERWGGLGGSLRDLADVAADLAGACASTAMTWAMHCQQTDAVIRFGSAGLRDRLLPAIARGELYLASVTTEPGKGGHLLTGGAALGGAGSGLFSLERVAPVVTGGEVADGFLITMRASPDARENELTLVYADRDQLEPEVTGDWTTLGMRGTRSVPMVLRGSVPADQVVGEQGAFREIAVESMAPLGHIGWAACWLGAARGALRDVVALVRSPRRPTSIDVESPLVRERLARVRVDLEIVSAYLYRTIEEVVAFRASGDTLDRPSVQIHLNTLKVVAAEHTYSAVDRLVQLCGMSLGYNRAAAVPLERVLRDLRSAGLNYANDRLLTATGALTLLDRGVHLAGTE